MPRILVVDDKPKSLKHLATASQIPGAEVVRATSAPEALQKIAEETFDVIVTDMKLEANEPKLGFEILKAAKEKDIYTQVIVITAYGTPEISVEAMSLGAFDYLERNFPGTDVLAMIKSKVSLAVEFRNAKLKESGVK
jgi:DNA-binding NtrC family response regulator